MKTQTQKHLKKNKTEKNKKRVSSTKVQKSKNVSI